MSRDRRLPSDPVGFIRECVSRRRIRWTYHVTMRLRKRGVTRKMIVDAVDHYELIEANPEDKYQPSYLILARYQDVRFHVLFAVDVLNEVVHVVTAYVPDPGKWSADLRTRRLR